MSDRSQIRTEVAVVLPCYNAEATLQRALDSVFTQTYRNCHVYAVDDGSTDRTIQILEANAPHCSYVSQAHRGPAAARNRAIETSHSPFIAFLDADDEWLAEKLQRQIALLKEQPDVGLVCSCCLLGESVNENARFLSRNAYVAGRLFRELIRGCFVFTPTVVVRRQCLDDVGLFRESLAVSEDFNLWLRIAARWRIAYLQEPLAIVHKRPGSLSVTVSDQERLRNGIAALQDVKANCGRLSRLEARALREAIAERFYFCGSFLLKIGAKRTSRAALKSALKLQMPHWRALAKLTLSFLPRRLFQSLLGFRAKVQRRFRIDARRRGDRRMFLRLRGSWIPGKRAVTFIFDQWLLNALLKGSTDGLLNRARYLALRAIRLMRLAFSDPVVSTSLGNCRLQLPLSHELPFYRRQFPAYSTNLGRISAEVQRKYPDLTMIDVGANVGDSVAIVRMFTDPPILCVEGESRFFQLLAENTRKISDIELEHTFVGATGDHIRAIRVRRGNAQVLLGPEPRTGQICTLSEVLARHPRFASTKLLKLDAEGFDCKILAAELELLKRNKPVLFFEYYPHSCQVAGQNALQIFPVLSEIGYSVILIYQNIGKYFMTLNPDQVRSIEDLHCFLMDLEGFCDVVAFHNEDEDLAARVRAAEYAARAEKNGRASAGNAG